MKPSSDHEPDEKVDLLNDRGKVIGQTTRWECHGNPDLVHGAVHIFVFNRLGQIFLQKRSAHKFIQPGKWDTSVGGHMCSGESAEEAARREMAEELGLHSVPLLFLHRYLWRTDVETELVTTYRCDHEGPFELDYNEIDEGRFFSIDELHKIRNSSLLTPNLVHELTLLKIL